MIEFNQGSKQEVLPVKQPNILFVFSDQHRFSDLGYAGNTDVDTPVLDHLAEGGAFFNNAFTNCPLCVPARGTLFTGLHSLRHEAVANDMKVRETSPSIASVLNQAGYDTAYIGKWHLGGVPRDQFITSGRRLGFTHWRGCNCNHDYLNAYYDDNDNVRHPIQGYEPIAQTTLALDFLEGRQPSQRPWAMWLCFGTPHDPYLTLPEGDAQRYFDRELSLRKNVMPIRTEDLFAGRLPAPDILKNYAGYYAHIRQIDLQVGRLVEWLKTNDQFEDTILVYTSDHGDMLGSHGYLGKQIYFDESVRIPFILSWPGHVPPGRRAQVISIADMAPTLLGLTGLSFETSVDGVDCSAVLVNPSAPGQGGAYLYHYIPCHNAALRDVQSWRAVTNERFTYVVDETRTPVSLFDRGADPFQMTDLINHPAHQETRSRLARMLDEQVARHDGYIPWEQLLAEKGLLPEWNRSQAYFLERWPNLAAIWKESHPS